jgi:hypothetical protein
MSKMKSPASALGEAVGHLVEEAVRKVITDIITPHGLSMGVHRQKISDKVGIKFEIDIPILEGNKIIALIDVKYLRYKKHARDKGSWVVVAHNRLKASYPEIKRRLVILVGPGWTEEAKRMISTSCIDVISVEPELLDSVLSEFGIRFTWDEKDIEIPRIAWENFQRLSSDDLERIKERIIEKSKIKEKLMLWFKQHIFCEDPEEKLSLTYICPEAEKTQKLNEFISGREQDFP